MRIENVKEKWYNGKKFTAIHAGKQVFFGWENGAFFAQYDFRDEDGFSERPPEKITGDLKQRFKRIAERRI